MAIYTAAVAKHATLVAATVDTVGLGRDFDNVEVMNRGTTELYFTAEGQTPTVGGDDCFVVQGGATRRVQPASGQPTQIKLISTAAVPYSVTGI